MSEFVKLLSNPPAWVNVAKIDFIEQLKPRATLRITCGPAELVVSYEYWDTLEHDLKTLTDNRS